MQKRSVLFLLFCCLFKKYNITVILRWSQSLSETKRKQKLKFVEHFCGYLYHVWVCVSLGVILFRTQISTI